MSDTFRTTLPLNGSTPSDDRGPVAVIDGMLQTEIEKLDDRLAVLLRESTRLHHTRARLQASREALLGSAQDE